MHEVSSKVRSADKARSAFICLMTCIVLATLSGLAGGCTTAVSVGVKLVGQVVDDEDVKKKAEQLIGQPPSVADEVIGERIDTLRDVNGSRQWIIYPVKYDVLNKNRYIAEVENGKITAVTKAEKYASKLDLPRALIYKAKTEGKSPEAVEEALELGKPLASARSENTGQLVQCYDAAVIEIEGISKPHYCIVRYDASDLCESLDLVEAAASTKDKPIGE